MVLNFLYWVYLNVFRCQRGIVNTLFQEDEPRKTLDIVIPPPEYPWVYISAFWSDNFEEDVTDIVNEKVTPNEILTPARLVEMTGLTEEQETGVDSITITRQVIRWEYMDSETFEVREITSDGLVNAVKSKTN